MKYVSFLFVLLYNIYMAIDEIHKFLEKTYYQQQLDLSLRNINIMQKYLNKLRHSADLTSELLGSKIGVSGQTILNLEKNNIQIKEITVKKIFEVFLQVALNNIEKENYLLFNLLIALFYYRSPNPYSNDIFNKEEKSQSFIESNVFKDTDILKEIIIFQIEKYNDKLSFPPQATPLIKNLNDFSEYMNFEFNSDWLLLSAESMVEALSTNIRNLRIISNISTDALLQEFNLKKSSYAHYELGTCILNISQAKIFLDILYSTCNEKTLFLEDTLTLIFSRNYKSFKKNIDTSISQIAQLIQSGITSKVLNYTIKQMLLINRAFIEQKNPPISLDSVMELPYLQRKYYFDFIKTACIKVDGMPAFCLKNSLVDLEGRKFDDESLMKLDPKISIKNIDNDIKIKIGIDSFDIEKNSIEVFIKQLETTLEYIEQETLASTIIPIKRGKLYLTIEKIHDFGEPFISAYIRYDNKNETDLLNLPSNKYNLTKLINELKKYLEEQK